MLVVEALEAVDRSLGSSNEKQRILNLPGWKGLDNPWMPDSEPDDVDYSYINLQVNPERYTGYAVRAQWLCSVMYPWDSNK